MADTEMSSDNNIEVGTFVAVQREGGVVMVVEKVTPRHSITCDRRHFTLDGAIGLPFGSLMEVQDGRVLLVDSSGTMCEEAVGGESGACGSDNRALTDDPDSQKLKQDDIKLLQMQGATQGEIVDKLIKNSSTFQDKTHFSQSKYISKKQQKHCARITIHKPTTRLLANWLFAKNPAKICNLRLDSLAQLLALANVHVGGRYAIFETCRGLVTGAVLERLSCGGQATTAGGVVIQLHAGDKPFCPIVDNYNFTDKFLDDTLLRFPIKLLGQILREKQGGVSEESSVEPSEESKAIAESSEISMEHTSKFECLDGVFNDGYDCAKTEDQSLKSGVENTTVESDVMTLAESGGNPDSEKRKHDATMGENNSEAKRRKLAEKELRREAKLRDMEKVGKMLVNCDLDAVIIATNNHPSNIARALLPFLSPSRPIVVFSPHKSALLDCYGVLRASQKVVNLKFTETFCRSYQVLSDRTHPHINMSPSGGYLLSAIVIQEKCISLHQ